MQNVSELWKQNQEQHFTSESFVEVMLTVGDPAEADATTSANSEEEFSNAAALTQEIDKNPIKYATLEKNQFLLDGTFELLPTSNYGEQGFISTELSNNLCVFENAPKITINFDEVFTGTIPGITIVWSEIYNEYATEFSIIAYGPNTFKQYYTQWNTSVKSVVELDFENYTKIEIVVSKWSLPNRRARIKYLTIGIEQTYTKSDIIDYSHYMFVDPLSASLPKTEIKMNVKNIDGEYNPDNPNGIAKYMLQRQMLRARYGYKINDTIEWIKGGTFYLSEWDFPQNGITASFTARDCFEYMSEVYTGSLTGSLYDIAERALLQANIPLTASGENRWTIDSSLQNIYPPTITNESMLISDVLQYCANAACCVLYQDRNGILRIEKLSQGSTDYEINRFNSYENSELSLTKQLKSVNINNGQYELVVGTVGEIQPITNPFISNTQAPIVAQWVADYLQNRQEISGSYRADPRVDALDRVSNENQFSTKSALITEVTFDFNGAFRGNYKGRCGA